VKVFSTVVDYHRKSSSDLYQHEEHAQNLLRLYTIARPRLQWRGRAPRCSGGPSLDSNGTGRP